LLFVCLFGWSRVAAAADWPQWRGPDRNGVASESPPLAEAWPNGGPRLLWRTESLMNGGKTTGPSSPVVVDGRVYLYGNWLAADAAGGAFDAVACLNAVSGTVLWHSEFPVADRHAEVRAQGSTPCISNVYGFDALTGQLRWHRVEAPGPWNDKGGWGACPSPVPWRHAGTNYVVCCCRSAELIDPATGQPIWKMPWVMGSWSSWDGNSSPTIVGDDMVVMQRGGGMEAFPLSLDIPAKRWHIPDHDCGTSALIYQGYVYTIGGGDYGKPSSIRCADLHTGKVTWAERTLPQGCSSPIAADGKIFGYVQFGKLLCMWKADPNHYTPLATAGVKADGYSSLAFADGHLFVRMPDGLACYDVTRASNPGAFVVSALTAKPDKGETAMRVVKFWQEKADKGDSFGQFRLGQHYLTGDGVEKDIAKARDLFQKAAAQGNKEAEAALQKLSQ
jgi:outer membrane protein assembly factor BamB